MTSRDLCLHVMNEGPEPDLPNLDSNHHSLSLSLKKVFSLTILSLLENGNKRGQIHMEMVFLDSSGKKSNSDPSSFYPASIFFFFRIDALYNVFQRTKRQVNDDGKNLESTFRG